MVKRASKIFMCWILIYAVFAAITFPNLFNLAALNRDGKRVIGVTTGIAPHNMTLYEFSVGHERFSGASATGLGGVYRQIPGAPIEVTYLPANPKVNSPGEISLLLKDQVTFSILGAAFVAILVSVIFIR